MDPHTQLLMLLLQTFSGLLPGTVQNQMDQQQQASQRQLSASDFAGNPNQFMGRMGNLLGLPGAASNKQGGGVGGISGALQQLLQKFTPQSSQGLTNSVWSQLQPQLAASGMGQSAGIANMELGQALAPSMIEEQKLGASEAMGALDTGLQTEQSGLQYPFRIGSAGAASFPSVSAF